MPRHPVKGLTRKDSRPFNVRLPNELYDALIKHCQKKNYSPHDFLRKLIFLWCFTQEHGYCPDPAFIRSEFKLIDTPSTPSTTKEHDKEPANTTEKPITEYDKALQILKQYGLR